VSGEDKKAQVPVGRSLQRDKVMIPHKQGFGNAEIEQLTVAIYALTVEIKKLLGIDSGRSVQRN